MVAQVETTVASNSSPGPVRNTRIPRNPGSFRSSGIMDLIVASNSSTFPWRITALQTLAYIVTSGQPRVNDRGPMLPSVQGEVNPESTWRLEFPPQCFVSNFS